MITMKTPVAQFALPVSMELLKRGGSPPPLPLLIIPIRLHRKVGAIILSSEIRRILLYSLQFTI